MFPFWLEFTPFYESYVPLMRPKRVPFHAKFNANNTFSHNLHKMLLLQQLMNFLFVIFLITTCCAFPIWLSNYTCFEHFFDVSYFPYSEYDYLFHERATQTTANLKFNYKLRPKLENLILEIYTGRSTALMSINVKTLTWLSMIDIYYVV
jgi:hypothetical protein